MQRIQAMIDAASNSYQSLSACIRGIAFIGTPHKGSAKAKWAEVGRQILKSLGKSTNPELLKDLEEKSEKLAKVGDIFPKLLKRRSEEPKTKIDVVCFFEGQPMNIGFVCLATPVPRIHNYRAQVHDVVY
jgi:hypothetical protein